MTEPSRAIITQPELARLQRIEAKLREVAGKCGECDGTGLRTIYKYVGHERTLDVVDDCPDCADIREALAAVTS